MSYSREGRSVSSGRRRQPRSGRSRSQSRSRESQDASNPGNNLYVTGLSTRVTAGDLEKYFGNEGKVLDCHLVTDPHTKESRGFAFVTMETVEGAERCIKYLNRSVLEGRLITVEKGNGLVVVQESNPRLVLTEDLILSPCNSTHGSVNVGNFFQQKGPEEEHRHLGGIKVCEIEEDKATDGLVAIHLDKMTEIIIQGVDEGDPVLVLHMVGEEMIVTYIGGAESAPCLVMAVVIVDERNFILHVDGEAINMTLYREGTLRGHSLVWDHYECHPFISSI
ncbi:Scaffold attachment factor B2 [Gossypium australe]|uniref:Scaffold attachment factor B2 n=1 Tax=Gossypium australe TaxID=47621 RepID=A0A5B6V294_9ROSI|nr:Scaffold attachment factor B2 [Gossypium australe]